MNAHSHGFARKGGSRSILPTLCIGLLQVLWQSAVIAAAQAPLGIVTDFHFDGQDDQGAPAQLSQWRGKNILLTMAYSTCRQVCNITLHRLEELQHSADRAGTPIEVIVVSYDPSVDGPGSWSIYRRHHHLSRANWHFLTGSNESTEAIANALGFSHWRYDDHVLHDFRILQIAPDGRIARTLSWANRDDDPFLPAAHSCPSSDTKGCNP